VVADLPVGDNLQDQVIGDGISFYTPYSGVSVTVVKAENFHSAWIYSLFGTGTSPLRALLGRIACTTCIDVNYFDTDVARGMVCVSVCCGQP